METPIHLRPNDSERCRSLRRRLAIEIRTRTSFGRSLASRLNLFLNLPSASSTRILNLLRVRAVCRLPATSGFRSETRDPELMRLRVKHDLYYIDHWSPWLDIKILLRTIGVVLWDRHAY
jgi:sugar transferase